MLNKKIAKVLQLSDKHYIFDDRIYWKYSKTLYKAGFDVSFAGLLNTTKNTQHKINQPIKLIGLTQKKYIRNRYLNKIIKYIFRTDITHQLFQIAKQEKADIYHIHNINLVGIGRKLKKLAHKPIVIYDVREPYPQHIIDYNPTNNYLTTKIKYCIAKYIEKWELKCSKHFDAIISNEENVANHFIKKLPDKKVEVIYNYTLLNPDFEVLPYENKVYDAIYCGVITRFRGAMQILKAAKEVVQFKPEFKLLFLGRLFDTALKQEMISFINVHNLLKNVEIKDFVEHNKVHDYYLKSKIGLGIFLPIPTHKITLQIKIFEYMIYGIPVVCSNFGHINNYTTKYNSGVSVNVENYNEIAQAILTLLNNPGYYQTLSSNAINAAKQYFTWDKMESKLIKIYYDLYSN